MPTFSGRNNPGHRGQLVLGGVKISGIEGASIKWNPKTAERGGWGDNHRMATAVMSGVPEISVDNPEFDVSQTAVMDLFGSMLNGQTANAYLYFFGEASDQAKYVYSSAWVLGSVEQTLKIEDIVRQPFSLMAAAQVYKVGF